MSLTVVSEQGLGRTLWIRAGGLRAAPAGKTNAAVGTAVTLTPHSHVAPIYAPLPPQTYSDLNAQVLTPLLASLHHVSADNRSSRSLTVSVWAPMDSSSAESWTIFSIAPEKARGGELITKLMQVGKENTAQVEKIKMVWRRTKEAGRYPGWAVCWWGRSRSAALLWGH